jgi:hypothetical protein
MASLQLEQADGEGPELRSKGSEISQATGPGCARAPSSRLLPCADVHMALHRARIILAIVKRLCKRGLAVRKPKDLNPLSLDEPSKSFGK